MEEREERFIFRFCTGRGKKRGKRKLDVDENKGEREKRGK